MGFLVQSVGVTGRNVPSVQQSLPGSSCSVRLWWFQALLFVIVPYLQCLRPVGVLRLFPCVNLLVYAVGTDSSASQLAVRINGGTWDMLNRRNPEVASTLRKDLNHFLPR